MAGEVYGYGDIARGRGSDANAVLNTPKLILGANGRVGDNRNDRRA